MPCPHKCKQDACDKKDLPPIHGNGNWRCAWIKNDKGEKEYACVVMVRYSNIGYIKSTVKNFEIPRSQQRQFVSFYIGVAEIFLVISKFWILYIPKCNFFSS